MAASRATPIECYISYCVKMVQRKNKQHRPIRPHNYCILQNWWGKSLKNPAPRTYVQARFKNSRKRQNGRADSPNWTNPAASNNHDDPPQDNDCGPNFPFKNRTLALFSRSFAYILWFFFWFCFPLTNRLKRRCKTEKCLRGQFRIWVCFLFCFDDLLRANSQLKM